MQREIRAVYLPDRYGTSVKMGVNFPAACPELEAALCHPHVYLTPVLSV